MGHARTDRRLLAAIAAAVVFALAVTLQPSPAMFGAPLAQAQEDEDDDAGAAAAEYAAGIHPGSCDSLGADPAFPLTTVAPHGDGDAGVFASETEVAAALADLLGDSRAIAILATGDDLATTRACADLRGQAVDGKLVLPLYAPDDDLLGVAVLEEREGATAVDLYLILDGGVVAVDDDGDEEDTGDGADGDGGV